MSEHPLASGRLQRVRPAPLEINPNFSQVVQQIEGSNQLPDNIPPIEPLVEIREADQPNEEPQIPIPPAEPLSSADETNMKILVLIRFLIMIQPAMASLAVSIIFLIIYISKSMNNLGYFSMIVPSVLFVFSIVEIILVSKDTKQDISQAIIYNIVNKAFYFVELALIQNGFSNPTNSYIGFIIEISHLCFFCITFQYKRKKAIFHFLLSLMNPLIISQIALVHVRLHEYADLHLVVFLLPGMIFCTGYLVFCVYFGVQLCREVCQLEDEEIEHQENQVQIKGFSAILLVVVTTNVLYLGLLLGGGFYLDQVFSKQENKKLMDHSFTIFLTSTLVAVSILIFIWMKRTPLSAYFEYRFKKSLKANSKEPSTPARTKIRSKFLLRMSGTFFNRDDHLVKKQMKQKNMVKRFTKDIQKQVEIQDSPSRIKRYTKPEPGCTSSVMKFKRMDSMQDIFATPIKADSTNVTSKRKLTSNKVLPSPENSPKRKQSRQSSVIISNFGISRVAKPDLPSPKRLRLSKQIIQREITKKMSRVLAKDGKAEDERCAICQEQEANAIVEPCLHGGCCTGCAVASYLQGDQRCVLCRQPISRIYRAENLEGNVVRIAEDITPEIPQQQDEFGHPIQ